jgi:hypothetical protein
VPTSDQVPDEMYAASRLDIGTDHGRGGGGSRLPPRSRRGQR